MKNQESLVAISTRIAPDVYDRMSKLSELTKKSTASLVQDAINEYVEQVFDTNYQPSKAMQIDQFAAKLERK